MATPEETLADALVSTMTNHVWNTERFEFFERMYLDFHHKNKESFPLSKLKSRQALVFQVVGNEAVQL